MSNETIILKELRARSKLKGEARFLSYRELECPPFNMNSPSKHMSRLRKMYSIVSGERINPHTQKTYSVFRIGDK